VDAIEVGSAMPELVLRDGRDATVSLAELRRERPALVVFLRHFG